MDATDNALPCPNCTYDLRGLPDGQCPECGTSFLAAELTPEQPGLPVERVYESTPGWRKHWILPLRICRRPVSSFQRQCRIEKCLTIFPSALLIWLPVWSLAVLSVHAVLIYVLNRIEGYTFIGYNVGFGGGVGDERLAFFGYLPITLAVTWVRGAAVVAVGLVIAQRRLSIRQVLCLATWITPLVLLGAIFHTIYDTAWFAGLATAMQKLTYGVENHYPDWAWNLGRFDWIVRPDQWGQRIDWYGHPLVFGLLAGLAVGTVLGRRRRLITLAGMALFIFTIPPLRHVEQAYKLNVYWPIRAALFGLPEQADTPPPRLFLGPTFTPGGADERLAGTWMLHIEAEESVQWWTFDDTGTLVTVRERLAGSETVTEYPIDGTRHEIPSLTTVNDRGDTIKVSNQGYALVASAGDDITIRLHMALEVEVHSDSMTEAHTYHVECVCTGTFNPDESTIAGTRHCLAESPGFKPGEGETPFELSRVADGLPD